MLEFEVTDHEIEEAERALLPLGCHFDEESRTVIRRWTSADVVACPGSGKTTVLLAKLKVLADRMPLASGSGVCVLSHTNVAIDELEARLPTQAGLLSGYPNHIGTIQSFVDKYFAAPYVRWRFGAPMRPVDDAKFGRSVLSLARDCGYNKLCAFLQQRAQATHGGMDAATIAGSLLIGEEGELVDCKGKTIAGPSSTSAIQFSEVSVRLLKSDGLVRYSDAYRYAMRAIDEMPGDYTELVCSRFAYVFIDEYQDCSEMQRGFLGAVFDDAKSCVMRIGDPDQAIYASRQDESADWAPSMNPCEISASNRFGQEIADILSPLRKDGGEIRSALGGCSVKPTLLVYEADSIKAVPSEFARLIDDALLGADGVFKAIGFVGSRSTSGISIGSYWDGFDPSRLARGVATYQEILTEICKATSAGKLYRAEPALRHLVRRLLRNGSVQMGGLPDATAEHQQADLFGERYRQLAFDLFTSGIRDDGAMDGAVRGLLGGLVGDSLCNQVFASQPAHFMFSGSRSVPPASERNVYIDPTRGTRIAFDTVHGVKGETHDATLYLETDFNRASDIQRVLYCYGVGKRGKSRICDTSRKVVYVGMSRPSKLLCAAVKSETFEKGRLAFRDWDVVELR